MENVAHVDALPPPGSPEGGGIPGALHRSSREDLVRDEDVILVAPGGVGAADEAWPRRSFDVAVKLVEIVLVLGDELRIVGTPALNTVPHIDDDQPVVPVAQIGDPILHITIGTVVALLVAAGAEAGDFLGMIGIVDVNDVQDAG